MKNRYSLTMINRNGYTIKRESNTVESLKQQAAYYPLESFFAWIYDKSTDTMIMQNQYRKLFKKCNNETYVPLY